MKYLERKMKNKFLTLILLLFLFSSCSGLGVKRSDKSDEFLIEKKNPLEIPPDFGLLPKPTLEDEELNQADKIDEDIEKLLQNSDINNSFENNDKSAEDFVLKQIKKN